MERTLISWTVPNVITIWLMLAIGFLALALISQVGMKYVGGGATQQGNNAASF